MNDHSVLPSSVMKWAGLKNQDPCMSSNGNIRELSYINDHYCNFQEIAELIDKNL
jgi:hypothetical protein